MPKETPASQEELSLRLDLIKALIVKGMSQREIVRYCREESPAKEWELTDRMVRNYVYRAKRELSDEAPGIDRREEFVIAKRRNDLLFNSSYKVHDFKTAQSANNANVKLMRLDDPKFEQDWRTVAEQMGVDTSASTTFEQMMQLVRAQQQEAELDEQND